MSRPLVVLTHLVFPEVVQTLAREAKVWENRSPETLSRDELLRRCRQAEGIMVFMPDRIDGPFLDACPRLQVVAGALKGYDNLDVEACTRRGVWVTNVPDLLTAPTADLAIGLLLAVTRQITTGDRWMRAHRFAGWQPTLYGAGLTGKTVGILGYGALGQAIARRLAGFDVARLYFDPSRPAEENGAQRTENCRDLLHQSDFVVIAAPITSETYHCFDAAALRHMKRGAYLINVGRGSVVDEHAVAHSLSTGHLAGYAADVFELEDQSLAKRPLHIAAGLLERERRTVFTPHLGSATTDARRQIELAAAANLLAVLRGETPPGAVNQLENVTNEKKVL